MRGRSGGRGNCEINLEMNIIQKTTNFLKEVRGELGKVTWSTREEVLGSTFVVITVTAILAIFIFVVDIILARLLNLILK
jgi:preprotein translocase subunit SecE